MNTYYIEASVGGTSIIKVEAESYEDAIEAAAEHYVEDWNNAGTLKPYDIHVVAVPNPVEDTYFDSSIRVTGRSPFDGMIRQVMPDDPTYDPDTDE